MDNLHSSILLSIFKRLPLLDMVRVTRVCKAWWQVLDENKALWRELVLTSPTASEDYDLQCDSEDDPTDTLGDDWEYGWDVEWGYDCLVHLLRGRRYSRLQWEAPQADSRGGLLSPWEKSLELFDQKSGGTLKKLSIHTNPFLYKSSPNWEEKSARLAKILERSKGTLECVDLRHLPWALIHRLDNRLWRFSRVIDHRTSHGDIDLVHLHFADKQEKQEYSSGSPSSAETDFPTLKVLWIEEFSLDWLKFRPNLLDRLVSLVLTSWYSASTLIDILERPSKTLKHLEIRFERRRDDPQFSSLTFPDLRILHIKLLRENQFPCWIKVPSTITLIIDGPFIYPLLTIPSFSKLWVDCTYAITELGHKCPALTELWPVKDHPHHPKAQKRLDLSRRGLTILVSMLRQRKANAEAGMMIDGVKLLPIKTLAIPKGSLVSANGLHELAELVEEVVDIRSVNKITELEI